uniref:EF-hand domain-containing protein n=1 Tax=Gopherus evgoodei TaxID=1825980 RepID=A0A8C4VVW4_9SAUR
WGKNISMTQLLSNIKGIINAFYVSAKTDGTCPTLSKGELKQLIRQEFADVTVVSTAKTPTIDKMLQLLDTDCDGRLDFNGFLVLVLQMAKACYKEVIQGQRQHKIHLQSAPQTRLLLGLLSLDR